MSVDDEILFDDAADHVVDLANRLAEENPDGDLWAIADGIVAGAVHYWLYAHQPQGDGDDEDWSTVATAARRLDELSKLVRESAEESEYFHTPNDADAGRA